ncbi:MAG: hypothetical protein M3Z04_12360 [Chloroflexota bacterium]|nr:hypothetical protein [Chloroflexota bacterium]
MAADSYNNANGNKQTQDDPAGWRGDYSTFWVVLLLFMGIVAGVALILEFVVGWLVWVLMGGILLMGWLVPVLFLVPRSAGQGSNLQLDKDLSGHQSQSQSAQDGGKWHEQNKQP